MVRNFTAVCSKVVQTFGQRRLQIGEATDIGIRYFGQFRHIVAERCLLDVEGFIRAPARQHFDIERAVFRDNRVVLKRINRIISGADHLHVHLLHDAACGEIVLRQQIATLVPDFVGSGWRQQFAGDTEWTTQLQMCPVIQRVTDGMRHGCRPRIKLFAVSRITGTQALSHTVGAHRTPFVMVTLQPDVIQVFEAIIFGNLLRR
ncbi:hypothetical protein D3C78_1100530 [compost metagenome]